MKRRFVLAVVLLVAFLMAGLYVLGTSAWELVRAAEPAPALDSARVVAALQSAPVIFIENVGQFPEGARFQMHGGDHSLWLGEDALWITVVESAPQSHSRLGSEAYLPVAGETEEWQPGGGVALKLSFPGSNPHLRLEAFNRLNTRVSYFIGNDPEKWSTDVPVWGGVRYKDLYPGIDLELIGENGHWQWRLVAAPDANLDAVHLRVEGAEALALDDTGRLRLTTTLGDFTMPLLAVEGAMPNGQPSISNLEVGAFEVASPFTSSRPLSGPSTQTAGASDLLYSTFLGGANDDQGGGIVVDAWGSAYVAGSTQSSDFPTTPGVFDASYAGSWDTFVVKLNTAGTALVYSTFLGGWCTDYTRGIAVDGSGNAYVTGHTCSSDFPTTPGAFDTSYNGDYDAFVVKVNAGGTGLTYATLLGTYDWDWSNAIAVDAWGNAYVTGATWSSDFPTTPGAFDTNFNGSRDAFVVKVNAGGTDLVYSTFLGGYDWDWGDAIAVDGSGSAYVTGYAESSDFPTTPGAFDTTWNGGWLDAFVVKVNAGGTGLTYATFLGGAGDELGFGIVMDASGNAYVAGNTLSSNFPTTPGAFDTSYNGGYDAFVVKVNAGGTGLTYATFLGGAANDSELGGAIAMDASGSAYVTSCTQSSNFPTTPGAFDTSYGGSGYHDAFVVKVNAGGTGLTYATFLGGGGADWGSAIALDAWGSAYVTGSTHSSGFPATPGALDTTYNGGDDTFVAKLAMEGGPPWTFIVYLDGDNSLDGSYAAVFNQLESAANNPDARIVVAWDRTGSGNTAYYKVQYDTDMENLASYTPDVNYWPKGELNMGDPNTLSDFVGWARTNFPAQHYALVIANHGTGLNGVAVDVANGSDWITVRELGDALSTATSNGANKIDVLYVDACLMGMIEDAYQARDYVDFYAASENISWAPPSSNPVSGPYDNYISGIQASTSPHDLAGLIVQEYANWLLTDYPDIPYTISASEVAKLNDLVAATNTLAESINSQMSSYAANISTARTATQKFDSSGDFAITQDDAYVDLYDFASEVKLEVPDATIQNAAQGVMDALGTYVISESHHSGQYKGNTWNLDGSHGVSIFFPPNASSFYNSTNYDFAVGATWPTGPGLLSVISASDDVRWGPMLVSFFNTTQPGGPITDTPPPLVPPAVPGEHKIYLPLIMKNY